MKRLRANQMSESLLLAGFLTLAGGFQDAYSYNCRGHVFANAQTGNMVFLGQSIAQLDFTLALSYAIPLLAFVCGIYVTERFHHHFKDSTTLHWRQIIVAIEIIMLLVVAFLPQSLNMLANVMMSFTSAMQINCFRKFKGLTITTTLCTGNLRTASETLCRYHIHKDLSLKKKCQYYYFIIFLFAFGAAIGGIASMQFNTIAILGSVAFLFVAFALMFIKEIDSEEELPS